MTTILLLALMGLLACSHHEPAARGPGATATAKAGGDDAVDPTLPSWAPPSCKTYHAAVIQLVGCTEVAQDVRDKTSAQYDADAKRWHDMQNATQADLDQVGKQCSSAADAAKSQTTANCAKGVGEQPVKAGN